MADLTRLGISLSKDGAKKLGVLSTEADTSQSAFIESFVWFCSSNPDVFKRLKEFIKERVEVEEALVAFARSNTTEARKLVSKLDK